MVRSGYSTPPEQIIKVKNLKCPNAPLRISLKPKIPRYIINKRAIFQEDLTIAIPDLSNLSLYERK